MVPTVERGLCDVDFCSIEIAGDKPFNVVNVRLVHHRQELPCVGRQRLNVSPLTFRVERVKRE
jgi:hypothetical protein